MPLSDAELVANVKQVVPDLEALAEYLGDNPTHRFMELVRPSGAETESTRAIVGGSQSEVAAKDAAFKVAAEGAVSAIHKMLDRGTDAVFSSGERDGTEAIIELLGRPAIFVQNGSFFPPAPPWEKLEDHRAAIEAALASVGRIEVSGHPALDWVGTGFLVAEGVVMTNRHVAKEFSTFGADGSWTFDRGMGPRIDFAEELGESRPREFALTEVIGVSDEVDMALLRATRGEMGSLPPPLPLTSRTLVESGREVYVIGYPASDSRRNDPAEMRRIFAGVYDIKRLQPGKVRERQLPDQTFSHDASTLGGNSGSCVVDLETHRVVGLHYSGRYLSANYAVDLTSLAPDALLERAGVQFE